MATAILISVVGLLISAIGVMALKQMKSNEAKTKEAYEIAQAALDKAVLAVKEIEILKAGLHDQSKNMIEIQEEFKELTSEIKSLNKGLNQLMIVLANKGFEGLNAL